MLSGNIALAEALLLRRVGHFVLVDRLAHRVLYTGYVGFYNIVDRMLFWA